VRKRMLAEYEKEKKRQVEQEAQLARLKARYLTLSQVRGSGRQRLMGPA